MKFFFSDKIITITQILIENKDNDDFELSEEFGNLSLKAAQLLNINPNEHFLNDVADKNNLVEIAINTRKSSIYQSS